MKDRRDAAEVAEDARVAMELFDLAAELLDRVRVVGAETNRRVAKLRLALIAERNAQLPVLDGARAALKKGDL